MRIFKQKRKIFYYRCLCTCFLLVFNVQTILAQIELSWNDFVDIYVDAESYDEDDWDYLEGLHGKPYNINTVSRNELLDIPFLNADQVDSILSYRERYSRYNNLGELLFIKNLNYLARSALHLFLYCDSTDYRGVKNLFTDGKSKVIFNAGFPLYRRDGNRLKSEEYIKDHPNSVFNGPGISGKFLYQYNYRQILQYGIGGGRDAGEPIMQHGNYPFDCYSGYILYQPLRSRCRALLGDFKLKAGEGLLLSNAFIIDDDLLFTKNRGQSIDFTAKRGVSMSFNSYRGLSVSYDFSKYIRCLIWASYSGRDANLRDGNVSSFKTDNKHRTNLELSKKNNVHELFSGMGIEYATARCMLGGIFTYTRFSRDVQPRDAAYTLYYFRGKDVSNGSIYGAYNIGLMSLHGELAVDNDLNTALSMQVSTVLWRKISAYVGYRRFSPSFVSIHGKTLSVNSRIANEEGGIMGVKIPCKNNSIFYANVNLFRFMKPLYRTSLPSYGFISYLKFEALPRKKLLWGINYQYKLRQYDEQDYLTSNFYNRVKFYVKYAGSKWNVVSQLCYNNHWSVFRKIQNGISFAERLSRKTRLQEWAFLGAIFYSDSYDTRNYVSVLSFPFNSQTVSLYGSGVYLSIKYYKKIGKHWDIGIVSSNMIYFNRSSISSGPSRIPSFSKNDIDVQVRYFL